MFSETYQSLMEQGWIETFEQKRSLGRAIEHAFALPCSFGRRTISRTICALGRQDQDWSADYKMFSRSRWNEDKLFDPVVVQYLERYPESPVYLAMDDTGISKTGKHIKTAYWQRDPMSPPFRVNLMYGLRFIQGSLLFPHHQEGNYGARAIPIRFRESPAIKKPGKKATEEQKKEYRRLRRQNNLSTRGLEMIKEIRVSINEMESALRKLFAIMDGSYCNKTIFKESIDGVEYIARCRKDARLCFEAEPGGRKKYASETFTPEAVRKNESIEWQKVRTYFGGDWREIKYKELEKVLWRRGGGTRKLRLIVIAAQPYQLSKNSRINYRQPAYLLTTDQSSPIEEIVQAYFDRWQIECNNRDEKSILGLGQAQVRAPLSVSRHPAFVVACYSLLLLASLITFGPGRTEDFPKHPKWRKTAVRPSLLDILTLLRKEIDETSISTGVGKNLAKATISFAYT